MELSLDKPGVKRNSSSERLQRAIERNRAKQAKRQAKDKPSQLPQSPKARVISSSGRTIASSPEETSFDRQLREPRKKMPAKVNYGRSEVSKTLPKKRTSMATKRAATPAKRAAAAKPKEKNKLITGLVYAGWICCMLLFIRLVTADRGVWHYYSRLKHFTELQQQFHTIQDTNQDLVEEIELISSNRLYQRKLIRDNLGFISSEEYLILFSDKRKPSSL